MIRTITYPIPTQEQGRGAATDARTLEGEQIIDAHLADGWTVIASGVVPSGHVQALVVVTLHKRDEGEADVTAGAVPGFVAPTPAKKGK